MDISSSCADKKTFYRRFSTLLNAGFGISGALEHLEHNFCGNKSSIIPCLKKAVSEGKTLADGMEMLPPDIFTPFETGAVRAGEASGRLPESLSGLAEYFEFSFSVKNRLAAGLTYPVILLHLAVILPAVPFLFLEGPGAFFLKVLPFMLFLYLLFFGAVFFYKFSNNSPVLTEKRDRVLLNMPWLGSFIRKIETVRFLQSFVSLYIAGLGIAEAVKIAGETTGNICIRQKIAEMTPAIRKGQKLSDVFARQHWMPSVVQDMIKTGEASGAMDETLARVSSYLKEEADAAVDRFIKILPVAAYLVAALYIGYIIVSFFARYLMLINSLSFLVR